LYIPIDLEKLQRRGKVATSANAPAVRIKPKTQVAHW